MPQPTTSRIMAITDRHRAALSRLSSDALPSQTREDVLAMAQTYQELMAEYIALQEAVGKVILG